MKFSTKKPSKVIPRQKNQQQKEHQLIQIGGALFKKGVTKAQISKQINEYMRKRFDRGQKLTLSLGAYNRFSKTKALFSMIKQLQMELIQIHNSTGFQIPDLIDIKFPTLKTLSINHNQLTSIENLQRIDFPTLYTLNLNSNLITNISSLRKIHADKIKKISLNQNKIEQFLLIQQMNCQNVHHISIQKQYGSLINNILQSQNFEWIFKIKSLKMKKKNLKFNRKRQQLHAQIKSILISAK